MDFSNKQLHQGYVVDVNPAARTYTVRAGNNTSADTTFHNCIWAAESFGGLLGFKVDGVLSMNSPVILMPGAPHMILRALPHDYPDRERHSHRTIVRGKKASDLYPTLEDPGFLTGVSGYPYVDLLEGEFVLSNYMGVFAAFLTSLLKLGASESAKIEFCLLDDLVRIVSRTFRHHSALGDTEIFDDGAPSMIEDFTSRTHEAQGVLTPGDPIATGDGKSAEPEAETLRSRFVRYTGWLGGFIHEIVTSPADALGALAQQKTGKSRFWRGEDGSVVMQGTGDIAIEYVRKVVCPTRRKLPDDPTGNSQPDFELPGALQALWDYGPDFKDAAECAFQLREYARWLNQAFCLARFHQLEDDWSVPSESASPAPDYADADEGLKSLRSKHLEPPARYACMRIFRGSGALMFVSGDGWSISSYNGDVYFDSPKNMNFRSAGDMHFISGGSLTQLARKDIEVVSTYGGLKAKSRTCLDMLCEDGSIHIKSDAVDPVDLDIPENALHDDLVPPDARSHGVIIESTKSRVAINGGNGVEIECSGTPDDEDPAKGNIILRALRGNLKVVAGEGVQVNALQDVGINTSGDSYWRCKDLLLDPFGEVQIKKGQFIIDSSGVSKINQIQTRRLSCNSSIIARAIRASSLTVNSAGTRSGKVGKNLEAVDLEEISSPPTIAVESELLAELPAPFKESLDTRLPSWELFPKAQWERDGERLLETYTQDLLKSALTEEEAEAYGQWSLSETQLQRRHRRTGQKHSQPWGAWMKQSVSQSSEVPLTEDSSNSGEDFLEKSTFQDEAISFKYTKPIYGEE